MKQSVRLANSLFIWAFLAALGLIPLAGCTTTVFESARDQIAAIPTLASDYLPGQFMTVTPVSTRVPTATPVFVATEDTASTVSPLPVPTLALPTPSAPKETENASFSVVSYGGNVMAAGQGGGNAPANDAIEFNYTGLTIPDLASRDYGGGAIEVVETLEELDRFTRYLVRYPSDGLTVYGFMNVPRGPGNFPVIIALHGFVDSEGYQTQAYTTTYADDLTGDGFIVIHPSYRNYPPSDAGDNPFRVGFAIDVLNLIALVRSQAGLPGPLAQANAQELSLWGHSMGGSIALRVLVVDPQIRKAVLYSSVSGDEQGNIGRISGWTDLDPQSLEAQAPPEILAQISPLNYLGHITAELSVHHGTGDLVAPQDIFIDLCARLLQIGIAHTCYNYDGQPHIFTGDADRLFRARARDFLRSVP